MDVKLVNNQVMETATGAFLRLGFEASAPEGVEALFSVAGTLMCANKILAHLVEHPAEGDFFERLKTGGPDASDRTISNWFWLGADFGPREVDFLEDRRSANSKGDVQLTARVTVRYVVATADRTYLRRPESQEGAPFRVPAYPVSLRDRSPDGSLVVLTDSDRGYLEMKRQTRDLSFEIKGSDWIHDYATRLGLGRFAVVEIPQPEMLVAAGIASDRVNEAISSARKAAQELREGHWDDVMESLRGVWELLRNQDEIQTLLLRDGYTPEAASEFNAALKSLFNLSSKFLHRLDSSKLKINPEITPRKEDAYLAFGLAFGALNLISRKHRRLS